MEIQLDDRVIEVKPHMTIRQYQNLKENEMLFNSDKGELLAMYLGISLYELKDLPKEQVKFVESYITNQMFDNKIKDETHFMFQHEGVTYGLETEWNKLPWGAWVDLEVYSSKDIEKHIHKIMAILYRPIESVDKKNKYTLIKYKSDEVDDRSELFMNLPIQYWFGVASFFFLVGQMYMRDIKNSLSMKMKINKMIRRGWKILPKWIKHKLPLDSILLSHTNSRWKTLQNSVK